MRNWIRIIGLWLAACGLAAAQETPAISLAADMAPEAGLSAETLRQRADSLLQLVYHGPVERSRQHHRAFSQTLEALVRRQPEPNPYLWESLEGLMYFRNTDGRLQLLNWSVPNINGTSSYGGLVWVKQPTADEPAMADSAAYLFYPLQDFSSYQPYPEALTLTPSQWWGAYYYQAVEHRQGDTLRLTLIGVNHSQNRYAQKVIDVLQLLPDGTVVFGAPVFKREALPQSVPPPAKGTTGVRPQEAAYPNAYIGYKPQGAADDEIPGAPATRRQTPAMRRIVFRYNPRTDLILRYDYQTYRRYHGKKAKETPAYMIVCDRLMHDPLSLDQTAARLVPAGGVYDAFVFQAPYWYPVEDVIARNPDAERGARHR